MSRQRASQALRAALAALALAPGLAPAEPAPAPDDAALEEAIAVYQSRDYAAALSRLDVLAAAGEPRAQTILGLMHESGEGVPPDPARAAEWYRRAAEQGYDPAQYALANLYRAGRGVPKDEEEAAYWYRAAAERGNRWAAARLDWPDAEEAPDPALRSLIERSARPLPARAPGTGIASDRLDALVARLPSLRAARAGAARSELSEVALVSTPGAEPSERRTVAAPPGGSPESRPSEAHEEEPAAAAARAQATPSRAPRQAYSVQIVATRSREQSERELARVARAVREVLPGADSRVLRVDLGFRLHAPVLVPHRLFQRSSALNL